MMDYLNKAASRTMSSLPFNELDNLLLSCFAYLPLKGIVPEFPGPAREGITIREAAKRFFAEHPARELLRGDVFMVPVYRMFSRMAKSRRFGHAVLNNLLGIDDDELREHFGAIEIRTGDGVRYISYRGSDSSLDGWKESFSIVCGTIPSEVRAANYLNETQRRDDAPIRTGGHSKGGHLAVFAAANCEPEIADRIVRVYSNEAPGFLRGVYESEGFLRIKDRVSRYIVESSVIGQVLDFVKDPVIVKSSARGFLQHDAFTWSVDLKKSMFMLADSTDKKSRRFKKAFDEWIEDISVGDRKILINDIFYALERRKLQSFTQKKGVFLTVLYLILDFPKYHRSTRDAVFLLANRYLTGEA